MRGGSSDPVSLTAFRYGRVAVRATWLRLRRRPKGVITLRQIPRKARKDDKPLGFRTLNMTSEGAQRQNAWLMRMCSEP
jgi:hypothetical protein